MCRSEMFPKKVFNSEIKYKPLRFLLLSFLVVWAILTVAHLPCVEGVTMPPLGGISILSHLHFDKPHIPSATSSWCDPK
jgi:hypothetical protein